MLAININLQPHDNLVPTNPPVTMVIAVVLLFALDLYQQFLNINY